MSCQVIVRVFVTVFVTEFAPVVLRDGLYYTFIVLYLIISYAYGYNYFTHITYTFRRALVLLR